MYGASPYNKQTIIIYFQRRLFRKLKKNRNFQVYSLDTDGCVYGGISVESEVILPLYDQLWKEERSLYAPTKYFCIDFYITRGIAQREHVQT